MNRRYSTKEFKEGVERLRKAYPNVALTTDVIVGFPGETDEEFGITYNFLQEIKFYKMHIFKYSPRKGTKAAIMPEQINGNIKEERSKKLIELSNKNEIEFNMNYIGKNVEVLFEEPHIEDGRIYVKGHTSNYMVVKLEIEYSVYNSANSKSIKQSVFLESQFSQLKNQFENKIKKVKIVDFTGLELIAREA